MKRLINSILPLRAGSTSSFMEKLEIFMVESNLLVERLQKYITSIPNQSEQLKAEISQLENEIEIMSKEHELVAFSIQKSRNNRLEQIIV